MKKYALILFFTVSLGELVSGIFGSKEMHFICKPLIMITLGIYYWIAASQNRSMVVVCAILFSFVGDTALIFESFNSFFFIVGLVAFLISHIFYILSYRQHQHEAIADALQGIQKMRFAFPVVLAGTGLVVVLYPVLGNLRFPVVIYAAVIVIMVLNALFRYGRTSSKSFRMVFTGAIAFMVSDSLLAINKFLKPIDHAGLLIMGTYILAQFLIIEGLCAHFEPFKNKQRS
ncbi:MAG: hypothetical protein C0490_08745 [Marivirga sp.]|nr:hypothetical protein [Marivirga sp.]